MKKGWVYDPKTGSWKKGHQSKISKGEWAYDPKTGSFAKGSSKKKAKSKKLRPGSYSIKKPGHIDRVNKTNKKLDEDWAYDPKTGSFADGSSRKKTKSKELSPEDKNHIDWVDKWGKKEETNKVPDYVSQEKKIKTENIVGGFIGIVGYLIALFLFIGFVSLIFDLGSSGFKKGTKYLDKQNYKKEDCIDETRNIENEFTAKKIYKACMKR